MGSSLDEYRNRRFRVVYIIYTADVVGSSGEIERMSPERHLPFSDGSRERLMRTVAARFTLTEDDDQYDYGYLAEETGNVAYRAVADTPACVVCASCANPCAWSDDDAYLVHGTVGSDGDIYQTPEDSDRDMDHTAESGYQGRHRKWVGELTRYEWLLFAGMYNVTVDGNGYPEDYEDTMGSLTEHGLLFAVSVDNSEGWQDFSGPLFVSSSFYVSFGA